MIVHVLGSYLEEVDLSLNKIIKKLKNIKQEYIINKFVDFKI
jgi:hypothetical protein